MDLIRPEEMAKSDESTNKIGISKLCVLLKSFCFVCFKTISRYFVKGF